MDSQRLEGEATMEYERDDKLRSNRKLTRLAAWCLQVVLIAGMLTALVAVGCTEPINGPSNDDNDPPVSDQPVRKLPDLVKAGDEFEITVTFTSPADGFHAIGLTEIVPADWSVTLDLEWNDPEATLARSPEPEKAEYIWEGPYPVGQEFTAVYKVKVPADAEPGTYTFGGSLRYYIEPHPAPYYEEDIDGDITVTVSS